MQGELGTDALVYFEYHISGVFATEETAARGNWYGVSGVPVVRIDGKYVVNGASTCEQSASDYRDLIDQRLDETGSMSPVEIVGQFLPMETGIPISATFRLVDPFALTDLRATLLIYEDGIIHAGKSWRHVVRDLVDEPIVLTNVGDEATVSSNLPVDPSWNLENLHAVAFLQRTSGDREVIQGAKLPVADFTFALLHDLESLPSGSGEIVFDGLMTNVSSTNDTMTLQLGEPFGDWPMDFFVAGNSGPYTEPIQVELGPAESCPIEIRIQTDDTEAIRVGSFVATSGNSTRSIERSMKIYNRDYSTLLVDDDWTEDHELPIRDALDAIGVLHESWDVYYVHGQDGPEYPDIDEYDRLIWHTGFHMGTYVLNNFDESAIETYVDAGGQVLFSSQHYLNTMDTPTGFVENYLGVTDWTLDAAYDHLDGVDGDPIGDALSLDLDFVVPFFNQGDDAQPGPNSSVVLVAPDGSNGMLRTEFAGGGRVIFMPAALHAVDDTGELPNCLRGLLERTLAWLEPGVPAGVEGIPEIASPARLEQIYPNPIHAGTPLSLAISADRAVDGIRLELIDLTGRRIASSGIASIDQGKHTYESTDLDQALSRLSAGIYFVRLRIGTDGSTRKLHLFP